VRAVSDAAETAVRCCGGFVTLPNGNYVSGWGGNPNHAPDITEETRFGARLFSLSFTGAPFVYRAIPLFTGQVSRAQFRAGMDAQYGP